MFIFPPPSTPVPIDPIVEGGFEASSRPGRYGQVRKCHCPPARAVIRAGSRLQGGKVIKGDRFQWGMRLRWGAREGGMLPRTWSCRSRDLSSWLLF